jgi:light-regulated signal transduction histidine kinase (bacteriophytochrome)
MNPELPVAMAGCEAEQLHLSGAIQDFGALLIVSATGTLTHASANVDDFLGQPAEQLAGTLLATSLPWLQPHVDSVRSRQKPGQHLLIPRIHRHGERWLDAWLVAEERQTLVELQFPRGANPLPIHRLQLPLLRAPGDLPGVAAYNDALLAAIQEATGFERVMLYRFHEDFSGEVIAERTARPIGSYLGLRFPAADIPAIARRLYLITPWRAIPDARASPCPVIGDDTPDLTHALLRSVSPWHLMYLENMGVRASFSVPIRIARQLWGLIACHHSQPLQPDPDACQTAATLAHAYAMGLGTWLAQQRMQLLDTLKQRIERITRPLDGQAPLLDSLSGQMPALLELLAADGVVLVQDNDFVSLGATPPADTLAALESWLAAQAEPVVLSHGFAATDPALAAALAPLAGVAAIRLHASRQTRHKGLRLYWFRREEIQEIVWAGNPDKPLAEDSLAPQLAPRRSFERWVELRQGVCRPWNNQDRLHCMHLRNALLGALGA